MALSWVKPVIEVAKFLRWVAPVLIDVLYDFFTSAEPTDNVRLIPKKPPDSPPQKPPVKKIPELDPPNKIKPPPTKIYKNPPNNFPLPPLPPIRILPPILPPSGTSTNTEINITSVVKQSLLDQKFGCLLSRPFFDATVDYCVYDDRPFSDFYDTLKTDMLQEVEEIKTEIENATKELGLALRTAVAYVSFDALSPPNLIMGTKNIHKIATYYSARSNFLYNFQTTGLIHVGETTITDCSVVSADYEEGEFTLYGGNDEIMIPLSAYDELEGYKADQLQIIWRNTDWKNKRKPKYFTIPQPKNIDTFSSDMLRGIFPTTFTFGATVVEIWLKIENTDDSIRPIQKCVVMTDHQKADDIQKFVYEEFKVWLEGISEKVTIKEYVAKHLDDSKIYVGPCNPYRAVYMGWDKDKKKWFKKGDWYLAK